MLKYCPFQVIGIVKRASLFSTLYAYPRVLQHILVQIYVVYNALYCTIISIKYSCY
jgi:hypothetical protein